MRLRSASVCAPTGEEWLIGRRWVTRERPRWRQVPAGKAAAEALSLADIGGPDGLEAALAVVAGAVVVAVIVIPLLLFGIELILLGLVVAAGILGRGLLGRPWIVEARRANETTTAFAWRVSGWRRSARLIDEVTEALSAGRDLSSAEAQATSRSPAPE